MAQKRKNQKYCIHLINSNIIVLSTQFTFAHTNMKNNTKVKRVKILIKLSTHIWHMFAKNNSKIGNKLYAHKK